MTDAVTPASAPTPPAFTLPPTRLVEPTYDRVYRANPNYRWWRPLVAVLLTAGFFLAVNLVLSILLMIALLMSGTLTLELASSADELTALLLPDMARPWTIAFGLAAIALVLPLVPLALRIAGIRPSGVRLNVLHSVLFRLRWRWLGETLAWSALVWVLLNGVLIALDLASGSGLAPFSIDPGTYAVSLVLVLLLVPVQAATEEYLYRGVLLQSIGAWVPYAVVPIVLSAVAFAFSHAYDAWGILQVGIMGVGFAWVTIRTGGLEAAIALHTVNNIGSFAIVGTGIFSGGETGMSTETGGPIGVIGQLVTVGLWVAVIEWRSRRAGIARRARIEVVAPPTIPPPPPGMPPTFPR